MTEFICGRTQKGQSRSTGRVEAALAFNVASGYEELALLMCVRAKTSMVSSR